MQRRHSDRKVYFREQTETSRKFYIDYLSPYIKLSSGLRVLEVGCGEGGNLVPFAKSGCYVKGIDIASCRIEQAKCFFSQTGLKAEFISADFLQTELPSDENEKYDIILLHDVIEHVAKKRKLLARMGLFLKDGGIAFVCFPSWKMPFGGHQQIAHSFVLSHLPFVHLLPLQAYRSLLQICHEKHDTIRELMNIRRHRMSICQFEHLVKGCGYSLQQRTLWLINPHYEQKFGLRHRRLPCILAKMRYVRDYLTTSCWYILTKTK